MSGYPTADTFGSLVDEVLFNLQGFGFSNDQIVTLVGNVSSGATSLTVDSTDGISRGLIEVDEELIYVKSFSGTTVTVPPWGRGFKGTTAAAHTADAPVYVSPVYPRSIVSREVNNTIRATYPWLFAVAVYDFNPSGTVWQFEMPVDMDRVISVEWRWTTLDGWIPVGAWELIQGANLTDFTTGKFLAINTPIGSGTLVHVTYAKPPSLLTASTDLYSASGLPASSRDVIVLGTCARLLKSLDAGRVPVETVAADALDQAKGLGTAIQTARQYQGEYQTRLLEERRALLERYPTRVHKVR